MAEIKEIRDAMRRKKRMRTVRRVSLAVILAALVIIVIINRDRLTPEAISDWLNMSVSTNGGEEGFPVKLPSGETVSISNVGSNIAIANHTNLYFYSPRGKLLRNVQHSGKNIQIKTAGNNVLTYSVGGSEVSVETVSKTAVSMDFENNITTGAVSKNGRFALAAESDIYTSEMQVFDKNGNAVFKWIPSGEVITSLALSDDGHYVAAATVFTQGGKIMSGIHFFETGKSEALFSQKLEDETVIALYCDKSSVRVISAASLTEIKQNGEVLGRFSFDEKLLLGAQSCSEGMALVFQDVNDPGKIVLSVIGDNAVLKATATVSEKAVDIACSEDKIYLLSDNAVISYKAATAVKTGQSRIEHDAERLCATSAGVYVITSVSELISPEIG